jgi:ferredoxin
MWSIDRDKCMACGGCVSVCPRGALELKEEIIHDKKLCILCKSCEKTCPVNAIKIE